MIKLTDKVEKVLLEDLQSQLGHYSTFGAGIDDREFVLVYENGEKYLAHKSEFECKGVFVKLKKEG